MMDRGGLLYQRCGGSEYVLAIPGQRRVNPPAVDHLLGLLRCFAYRDDMSVPSFG
jgi:hypothetical protein